MAKKKYYVVWKGHVPGIYSTWNDCKLQIDGFTGAVYKSFENQEIAENAFAGHFDDFVGKDSRVLAFTDEQKKITGVPIAESLSVDAACSGNPGVLEYRGVDTKSGIQLFRLGPFPEGTVNIGEFLALVHGLAYLKKQGSNIPVYSDSRTAMAWVRNKAIRTTLLRSTKNEKLFELVDRALVWIKNNSYSNKILKWETKYWGEIPADFGRK